jgi:hypothetical protein
VGEEGRGVAVTQSRKKVVTEVGGGADDVEWRINVGDGGGGHGSRLGFWGWRGFIGGGYRGGQGDGETDGGRWVSGAVRQWWCHLGHGRWAGGG